MLIIAVWRCESWHKGWTSNSRWELWLIYRVTSYPAESRYSIVIQFLSLLGPDHFNVMGNALQGLRTSQCGHLGGKWVMWPKTAFCLEESQEHALEFWGILWGLRDIPLWASLPPWLPSCSAVEVCKGAGCFLQSASENSLKCKVFASSFCHKLGQWTLNWTCSRGKEVQILFLCVQLRWLQLNTVLKSDTSWGPLCLFDSCTQAEGFLAPMPLGQVRGWRRKDKLGKARRKAQE